MHRCHYCGKTLHELPYKCRRCGHNYCSYHHLPENHKCRGNPYQDSSHHRKNCENCGRELYGMPYKCHRCGKTLCDNCRLPKYHNCIQQYTPPFCSAKQVQKSHGKKGNAVRSLIHLIKDIFSIIVIIIISGIAVIAIILFLNPAVISTHNPISDTIKPVLNYPTETSIEQSKESLSYINNIRKQYGKTALSFDDRIYYLAKARGADLDAYNYLDHTNPITGTCAWSMKSEFGLKANENAAENVYGSKISTNNGLLQNKAYESGIEKDAVDSWLTSRGHRYNLLYSNHISGAIYCSPNSNCVFLGLNSDNFGEGCHTGTEGFAFWGDVGTQLGEV
jgi:uncharacterized protein YkwD